MRHINPLELIGRELNSVQNPVRYLGGEYGICIKKDSDVDITFVIAFPDVYEIAMSNQAVKIIYNGLNAFTRIRCERVFAVEPDYELLLKKKHIPLYTLETGIPLCDTDIIGFSIGYELGITGVFSILETGTIPVFCRDRSNSDPIIIAGGCGVTNPMPFAKFFDAVFIGEAENGLFELIQQLGEQKRAGAGRSELLRSIAEHPAVWMPGKSERAKRAVWNNFGKQKSVPAYFPQPTIRPVQDHGVVEIMRGCPNGCRFCHAGIYYRPQRVKSFNLIEEEVDNLIYVAGYREISLTSLSSGDYPQISSLLYRLTQKYSDKHISFQLPSLKVNSFTLPLIEQVSQVRKSGLTFAVETPEEAWQLALNKEVYSSKLTEIILQAKKCGWSKAKFYFMIGLPFEYTKSFSARHKTEEEAIVDFLLQLQRETRIQCHVNIGTFVPKPHTPYQWCRQISIDESRKKIAYIREHLPRNIFKVTQHNEYAAFLEGLISRGDERVGDILYAAYSKGCRLDAWDDKLQKDLPLWEAAVSETKWDIESLFVQKALDETLPWDSVSLGPTKFFYKHEWQKSCCEELTRKCVEKCKHRCGVCDNTVSVHISDNSTQISQNDKEDNRLQIQKKNNIKVMQSQNIKILWRVIFSFRKMNGAEYIPHLALQEIFYRAMLRSGFDFVYTSGFNPIPRIEFASTLATGIPSNDEIVSCLLCADTENYEFIQKMNMELPSNLVISNAFIFPVTNKRKRESLASLYWGSKYLYQFSQERDAEKYLGFLRSSGLPLIVDKSISIQMQYSGIQYILFNNMRSIQFTVPFSYEKKLRECIENCFGLPAYIICSIEKIQTYAISNITGNGSALNSLYPDKPVSYFELYSVIAQINQEIINRK